MRFSLVILFAASLVSAASVFNRHNDIEVPSCATTCRDAADPTPCKRDDTACLCVNDYYIKQVNTCAETACNDEDAKAAWEANIKYCKAAGIGPGNPWPLCGARCINEAPAGNCTNDSKCLCQEEEFLDYIASCFKKSCQGEDIKTSKCVTEASCRALSSIVSFSTSKLHPLLLVSFAFVKPEPLLITSLPYPTMRFSLVVLFAASVVSAFGMLERDIEVPECAVACEAASDPGHCDREDPRCLCLNVQYITDVSDCVQSSCSPEDAEAAAAAGAAYCKEAGIDWENPFPSCGVQCEEIAPPAGCAQDDGTCICNSDEYIQSFAKCIQDSCTGEDIERAASVGAALCRVYASTLLLQR
ncbi:hypothetical protein M407DRAFT_30285 [Tulasnella calospora MUT 4182]|uniref:CFEM domain-containing protein n=1 Tax=Tulasnella calospora MUT 4182 TaxID=1051891 RepID=A0A0C3KF05_9AGAM|nr:hypothetical protein M407DRAFT_30285 [Tulasnella calospora MUT 4182]